MRRVDWLLIILVLIGFVVGNLLGTYFNNSFLSYGTAFGLTSPVELNLGFLVLTFGLTINITIAGVIGVIVAFVIYRFIR